MRATTFLIAALLCAPAAAQAASLSERIDQLADQVERLKARLGG